VTSTRRRSFTITVAPFGGRRARPLSILLRVYESAARMRREATDYSPSEELTGWAFWQPNRDKTFGRVGILRLSEENLTTTVVSHEAIHAAMAVYRRNVQTVPRFASGVNDNEELLAYIAGDVLAGVQEALGRMGYQLQVDRPEPPAAPIVDDPPLVA
jgi:hypothetical protein